MRFLVDNQLPLQLARYLQGRGHDSQHVVDVGLGEALDHAVWQRAIAERRVVISKDEDSFHFANRPGDDGSLLWIRVGNCRKAALLEIFDRCLDAVVGAFESGQRIVELG